jgi:hypothetical protein
MPGHAPIIDRFARWATLGNLSESHALSLCTSGPTDQSYLDCRRMTYDGGKEDWEQQPEQKSRSPLLEGDQLENLTTCFELDRGTS